MKRIALAAMVTLLLFYKTNAQFTVTADTNATQMAQLLAGNGVTVSNAVLNCNQGSVSGAGKFANGSLTNLGMNNGVVLTTGSAAEVDTAAFEFASHIGNNLSDAQLDALSPMMSASHDRCVLEFDVTPLGTTLRFKYVFASEEYEEYVCSNFADVFGFFITGPDPAGGSYTNRNIAMVPGTSLAVSINTINPGIPGNSAGGGTCGMPGYSLAYSSLYVDNYAGTSVNFDGHTVVLTAEIPVVPGQAYHLKLAIADVSDQAYDSGVFLQAGSLSSNPYNVQAQGVDNPAPSAVEGCGNGGFRFSLDGPSANPLTISYSIGGTAVNGTDYAAIDTFITIAAGDTVGTVNIIPVADAVAEGNETVVLYLYSPVSNQIFDSVMLYIADSIVADATASKYAICQGEQITLSASGGNTYLWLPGTGVADSVAQTTVASPLTTTQYVLKAMAGNCVSYDSLTVQVDTLGHTASAGPDTSICINDVVQLQGSVMGVGVYTSQWFTTAGSVISTANNVTVTPATTTTYVFAVNSGNCVVRDSVTINVSSIVPLVNALASPLVVCPGEPVQLDFVSNLPLACGVNPIPGCAGTPQVDTIKTGYAVQGGNPYTNVTFYGNFYQSTRMQMIYSAAELQAILGGGGTISQLAWQIGIFNSNATLENFTISLKCVPPTQTTLSTWETGMQRVYGPKLYTPAVPPTSNGWNNHSLDSLYDWDGTSSLVVEVCFYNPNTSSNLVNMMTYSNVPNSVLYGRANANQCALVTNPTQFGQRFNMRVHLCPASYAAFTIAWNPATGLNSVSNPAVKNPIANPTTNQTYRVSATYNGCTRSDSVTVTVLSDTICDTTVVIGIPTFSEPLFTLHPNPAANYVVVNYQAVSGGDTQELSLLIYNATGRLLYRKTLPRNSSSQKLDVSELPTGIYFVTFQHNGNKLGQARLVKE